MKVDPNELQLFLSRSSFEFDGDCTEQEFGRYLSAHFPNCENFWRNFVVPLTRRMEGYPDSLAKDIRFRESIDPKLEVIANAHYSMFTNLVYAHMHWETKMPCSLEDIYAHLGSACDLAETVIESWYLLLLQCQRKQCYTLQKLTRDEFLELAGEWYDKHFQGLYDNYLSRGKTQPLKLPSRQNLLQEYLGKDSQARKDYLSHSQPIREFRNVIIHNTRIGKIETQSGEVLIPKPTAVQSYRSWRQVFAVANDHDVLQRDFVERWGQSKQDIDSLESSINRLWDSIVAEIKAEFYSDERSALKDMFDIKFTSGGVTVTKPGLHQLDSGGREVSASGIRKSQCLE